MHEALETAHIYPDGGGYYLREAIAENFGSKPERDSRKRLQRNHRVCRPWFPKPDDEVITARHAFAVYKLMATLFGAKTIEVPDPNFAHDLDAMADAITPRTRGFRDKPEQPDRHHFSQAEIDRFIDRVPPHVVVVFDEAYHEFLKSRLIRSNSCGRDARMLWLLRTFSKIQGLASLRIGYGFGLAGKSTCCKKRGTVQRERHRPGRRAGGLLDEEHQIATRTLTNEGRDYLQRSFAALGLKFVPSSANFVLVKVGDGRALFQQLLPRASSCATWLLTCRSGCAFPSARWKRTRASFTS